MIKNRTACWILDIPYCPMPNTDILLTQFDSFRIQKILKKNNMCFVKFNLLFFVDHCGSFFAFPLYGLSFNYRLLTTLLVSSSYCSQMFCFVYFSVCLFFCLFVNFLFLFICFFFHAIYHYITTT